MFFVSIYVTVEGFHRWPGAPDSVSYLRDRHRHEFVIRCEGAASHADRDREIFTEAAQVRSLLGETFGTPCEFGLMSCEDVAEFIAKRLNYRRVDVLEDGFSGGGYIQED